MHTYSVYKELLILTKTHRNSPETKQEKEKAICVIRRERAIEKYNKDR